MRNSEITLRTFVRGSLTESSVIEEGWKEILGDVGLQVIASGPGRKLAAKALHGVASVILVPTKLNNKDAGVFSKLAQAASSLGGFETAARGIEAMAQALEAMSDDDAAMMTKAIQSLNVAGASQ